MKLAVSVLCLVSSMSSIAAAQAPGDPPPPPPTMEPAPPPPPPTTYQPPPQPGYGAQPGYGPAYGVASPTARRHDGFYLRMFLGLGYTSMELEDQDVKVSGTGGAFGIALGWAVADNLIVFAELFDDIAVDPKVEMGGSELETEDVSAGVVAFGGGIAYYFQPHNIYVSGTISWGQLTVQENNREIGESEFGPGLSLMVGKEWWVSDNWGLGGALQLYGGRMKDKGDNAPTWQTSAIALTFSATYN